VECQTWGAQTISIGLSAIFLTVCSAPFATLPRPFKPLECMIAGTLLTAVGLLLVFLRLGWQRHRAMSRLAIARLPRGTERYSHVDR